MTAPIKGLLDTLCAEGILSAEETTVLQRLVEGGHRQAARDAALALIADAERRAEAALKSLQRRWRLLRATSGEGGVGLPRLLEKVGRAVPWEHVATLDQEQCDRAEEWALCVLFPDDAVSYRATEPDWLRAYGHQLSFDHPRGPTERREDGTE